MDVPELGYFSVEDKGEVCFRGAALMNGYFNEDDLNRKTIDEEVKNEHFFPNRVIFGSFILTFKIFITDKKNLGLVAHRGHRAVAR